MKSENMTSQTLEELKNENTRLKKQLSDLQENIAEQNNINEKTKSHYSPYFGIRRKRIGYILLLVVLVLSSLNIAGWLFDIPFFKSFLPNWATMKPVSSFCLILSAFAVAILQTKKHPRLKNAIVNISGVSVALIAFLSIISFIFDTRGNENTFSFSPFLNSFLLPEKKMALVATILFIMLSSVLLMLKKPGTTGVAHALTLIIFIISYFVPVSYILGITSAYSIHHISVALYSGISFCLLSVAILLLYPETWFMKIFVEKFAGGHMARKLIPGVLIIPLIIGWLRINGERAGFFSTNTGIILVVVAFTFCFLIMVWWAAKSVIKIDVRQRFLDTSLRQSEEQYKQLVELAKPIISGIQ